MIWLKAGEAMEEMSREEFERQKAESARRIREMYRGHAMPPYPEFLRPEPPKKQQEVSMESPSPLKVQPKHDRTINGLGNIFNRLNVAQIASSSDGLLI